MDLEQGDAAVVVVDNEPSFAVAAVAADVVVACAAAGVSEVIVVSELNFVIV